MIHKNSKIVYLKRARPFIHEAMNTEEMQFQIGQTSKSIGSYYAGLNSTRLGTGLSPTEEKVLIPALLGIEINDKFYDKLTLYYTEIFYKIPAGAGMELQIGLELDNTKPVTHIEKDSEGKIIGHNLPIDIAQYIRYRHALAFPFTAPSKDLADGNSLMQFYIEDPKLMLAGQMSEIEVRDQALVDYTQIKSDPQKVKMMVTVMRHLIKKRPGKPPININNIGTDEMILLLRELAVERPDKFHEFAIDGDLKKRYYVDELVGAGFIQRVGNSFLEKETGYNLGDTMKEVVTFLWNPKESLRLNRLKAQYDGINSSKQLV